MEAKPINQVYQYCPQCGTKSPSPGTTPFRCHQCSFANFFGPVAAVGALVVNDSNQLLLIRRARQPGKGKWGLPGGFVDAQETGEEATAREVFEEVGLRITAAEFLMTFPNEYNYQGVVAPVIDLFFIAKVDCSEPIVLAHDEVEHYEWTIPTAEHLDNMAFHSNRVALESWLKQN